MSLVRVDELRVAALSAAVSEVDRNSPTDVIKDRFITFLRLLTIPAGVLACQVKVLDGKGNTLISAATQGGRIMTAMTVDQTATISVLPEDDHGDVTADMLTWVADDGGTIGALTVAADSHSATFVPNNPGGEGTVNITVSDPNAPQLAPFTAQLVIGPGATASLVGSVSVA